MMSDRFLSGFGELRGLFAQQVAAGVQARLHQARLMETLCALYDEDAARFEAEVFSYTQDAQRRAAPRLAAEACSLDVVQTMQALERGPVASLAWAMTLDGSYGEGPVLAMEALGEAALRRLVLHERMPPRWGERVLRSRAGSGVEVLEAPGTALVGLADAPRLRRLTVLSSYDAASLRALELGAPALEALDLTEASSSTRDLALGWLERRALRELRCGHVPQELWRVIAAQLGGETLRTLRLGHGVYGLTAVASATLEELALGDRYGTTSELLGWFGRGRWSGLRTLRLRLRVQTEVASLRAAMGAAPGLERLYIEYPKMSAAYWYLLWSERGLERLTSLKTLELICPGGLDDALEADVVAESVERMPQLAALRCDALRRKRLAAQLAGTRAGALLGLEEA
jgi:hypothetical protein